MNPFYDLYNFYEQNTKLVGKKFQKEIKSEKINYFFNPIGFTKISPKYVFEITDEGTLSGVYRENNNILAPMSLTSNIRTNDNNPHILFDKIEYFNVEDRKEKYLEQLKNVKTAMNGLSKEFDIISDYILKDTVYSDLKKFIPQLVKSGLKEDSSQEKILKEIKKEFSGINKNSISFKLISNPDYFESMDFINIWSTFYMDCINKSNNYPYGLDYLTGNVEKITNNVSNAIVKGKLTINSDFTIKEQFENISPVNIGFIPFEKAMNSLKFLSNHQSVNIYAGNSRKLILINKIKNQPISENMLDVFTDLIKDVLEGFNNEKSYQKELYELISGKNIELLSGNFMLLTIDNLTQGRASIIDYHPLTLDYLENLAEYANEVGYSTHFILRLMQHRAKDYKKLISLDHKMLFEAIQEGRAIPYKIINGHFRMLSNPKSTVLKNNEDEYTIWSRNLNIFEKIYLYKKEGLPKMLDKNYTNRSYLFGRALAVYHHVESRSKKEFKNKNNTIAYKFFNSMQKAPNRTIMLVKNRTLPYFKKDKFGKYFEDIILEITDKFSVEDFNSKAPLDENFLLGYNHQLKELRTFKKTVDKS